MSASPVFWRGTQLCSGVSRVSDTRDDSKLGHVNSPCNTKAEIKKRLESHKIGRNRLGSSDDSITYWSTEDKSFHTSQGVQRRPYDSRTQSRNRRYDVQWIKRHTKQFIFVSLAAYQGDRELGYGLPTTQHTGKWRRLSAWLDNNHIGKYSEARMISRGIKFHPIYPI